MLKVNNLDSSDNCLFSLFLEVLVMKRGAPYGGPGGEDLWDDAEIAALTFNDTIIRVTASQSVDLAGVSRNGLILNKHPFSFFFQENRYYFLLHSVIRTKESVENTAVLVVIYHGMILIP